jgi:hypothetical protein
MKHITLAVHKNELIIVNDMETFTKYFCYSKKQRPGPVDLLPPPAENPEDAEMPTSNLETEETEATDDDDLLN